VTDLEKLKALLDEFGVQYTVQITEVHNKKTKFLVQLPKSEYRIRTIGNPYSSDFYFNSKGKFGNVVSD